MVKLNAVTHRNQKVSRLVTFVLIYAFKVHQNKCLVFINNFMIAEVVAVGGTHLRQDIAGSLAGVSWRCDNGRVASSTMMGKYCALR